MSKNLDLLIDLNEAGLDLEPEELEVYSRHLMADLKDNLAEDVTLVRKTAIPEGSKSGQGGFDLGMLKAVVNLKNLLALMNLLKEKMAGATLTIEYGDVKLVYRNQEQLEQQLQAIEKISRLTVRVVKGSSGKE